MIPDTRPMYESRDSITESPSSKNPSASLRALSAAFLRTSSGPEYSSEEGAKKGTDHPPA
ncbi:hypothetical protein H0H93_003469, partial [Arthromyces matolae]